MLVWLQSCKEWKQRELWLRLLSQLEQMRWCQERLHHQQKQPPQILPLVGGVPGLPW